MILKVALRDLRRMLKDKCDEIFADEELSRAFYQKIAEIEEDERFVLVEYVDKAVELLEEQEPVKPAPGMLCGECGCRIYQDANYCYNCGRPVKWDD